ncbi:MAG: hypothetical protein V4801_10350 [Burkholderia gladioli]
MNEIEFDKIPSADRASTGDVPEGLIASIVRAATARTCLSCGAKEAADGSLPCNH